MISVRRTWLLAVAVSLIARTISTPTALSVTPSLQWYGDDGSWSAISIRVGTPPQWVDVMVSTVSSETWAVASYGCASGDTTCAKVRGGLFNSSASSSWQAQGNFDFGVDTQLGNTGYAEYGFDDITFGTTGITLPDAIIGSFEYIGPTNTTQYLTGYFGLGIVPENFTTADSLSAISGLVEKQNDIPSHSYGFTAGASYQQKGEPISLTLGGYDANRFVPHNVTFELNPQEVPQAYINSISVISANSNNNWTLSTELLHTSDKVSAIIDSTTPFLWLPVAVCERFASNLGLSYNDTLNLYSFDKNATQHDTLAMADLTFTFSLSDVLSSEDIINITLPYAAFDLQLSYPAIPGTTYEGGNNTKNYFPLRQASSEVQYTIGRAFLQEAYLITDYERNTFSVHQAVHTADPLQNTSIVSISRSPSSTLSGPPSPAKAKFSTGAIVGITIGAVVIVALVASVVLYLCRRRRFEKADNEKILEQPRFIDRFRRRRPPLVHEASGSTEYPLEVGADATHERFELAAPLGPVELDSDSGTLDGTTENGDTQDSSNLSSYERARRKLERQQAATKGRSMAETYLPEKTENDASPTAHYRPPDIPDIESPLVSPVGAESGGSLTISGGVPSPISPGFVSSPTSPTVPPPSYTRINPAHVVYAGRLPDNVQLPAIVPRLVGPDGRTISTQPSTLGSQYTENEEDLYSATTRHFEPSETLGTRRRLGGEDLVHIPQPAENRFSWEEERTDGTD